MKIDYSKSLNDIGPEMSGRFHELADKLKFQQTAIEFLNQQSPRSACLLCRAQLAGEQFIHRGLMFVVCGQCGHIQTLILPPADYPFCLGAEYAFNKTYPQVTKDEFADRRHRVYQPKLNWLIKHLLSLGLSQEEIINKTWLELGCGGGYFLSALEESKITKIKGVDADQILVDFANNNLKNKTADFSQLDLAQVLREKPADIYVAWFVIEHLTETWHFIEALNTRPTGAIFVFSVPVFGLSCLLEGSHPNLPARSLDGVVHTQMFTEDSIDYLLKSADYEISAQWIFGQDAEELLKTLWLYQEKLPSALRRKFKSKNSALINEIQKQIDSLHLADQRHIIAIKK